MFLKQIAADLELRNRMLVQMQTQINSLPPTVASALTDKIIFGSAIR